MKELKIEIKSYQCLNGVCSIPSHRAIIGLNLLSHRAFSCDLARTQRHEIYLPAEYHTQVDRNFCYLRLVLSMKLIHETFIAECINGSFNIFLKNNFRPKNCLDGNWWQKVSIVNNRPNLKEYKTFFVTSRTSYNCSVYIQV